MKEKDKYLLKLEWLIILLAGIILFGCIYLVSINEFSELVQDSIIVIATILFAYSLCNAIKIEQIAGKYECNNCHHKYVPTYMAVFWAMHFGRTRWLKCPKCNEKSWNRKVLE